MTCTIRPFRLEDAEPVVALWGRCDLIRPTNDPRKDIARKLKVRGDLFLVAENADGIVGTIMIGYEGHRGWINYLAVAPEQRRRGLGRKLMAEAEQRLRAEGCPKINLQVRKRNVEAVRFYEALRYRQDEVLSFGLRLEEDVSPGGAAKPAD
jgi:ribosomal protein S18 acetylase RimI-like enzyme